MAPPINGRMPPGPYKKQIPNTLRSSSPINGGLRPPPPLMHSDSIRSNHSIRSQTPLNESSKYWKPLDDTGGK